MSLTREPLIQRLLDQYTAYYDITRIQDDSPLQATCFFHSRNEKYVLTKRAQLWAAENHEYLYLFSLSELNEDTYAHCRDTALSMGMEQIHPHPEHMYSYITAVILCDRSDPDTLAALQRFKKSQSFKLSLHGWMEFRIAAVDLSTAEVFTNRKGKDLQKFLRKVIELETKRNSGEEKKSV